MYLVQVSLLLIGKQGFRHFVRYWPLLPLAGGLCKFYVNAGGKRPIQRQPLLVHYKHQASPLLFINAPLMISGNDKNKPTLLSQRKLALTARNTLFKESLEHLKNVEYGPVLYLGLKLTIQVIKRQIHLVRQSL